MSSSNQHIHNRPTGSPHQRRALSRSLSPLLILIAAAPLIIGRSPHAFARQDNTQTDAEPKPLEQQPYLGLSVRDHQITPPTAEAATTTRVIVSWIYPGPLQGESMTSPFVNRGDFVLAVNGAAVSSVTEFNERVSALNAGEKVTLRVQRTSGDTGAAIPTPGSGTSIEEFTVALASRADWSGPVARERPQRERIEPEQLIPGAAAIESFIMPVIDEHDLTKPVNELRGYFMEALAGSYGANMLGRVAYGFHEPFRLDRLQTLITDPLVARLAADPAAILDEAADNLDVPRPARGAAIDLSSPDEALRSAGELLAASTKALDQALAGLDDETRSMATRTMPEMADFVAANFYITGHEDVGRLIRTLNASMKIDFGALLGAASALSGLMSSETAPPRDGDGAADADISRAAADPASGSTPLPDALAGAIDGTVLAVLSHDDGWLIYGGPEANTYTLDDRIAIIIDAGGSDTYRYAANGNPRVQAVVDLAGDDRYLAAAAAAGEENETGGNDGTGGGPACGRLGVNIIVDHAGADLYEGASRSCGVGLMGVGATLDYAGADRYRGKQWSLGAAFYGLGALVDLGGASDEYLAETFSEGVGGPRGFGIIFDDGGRDLYRANGPVESVYGSDAVHAGISQGVGFGVRGYDTGGIGVLCDVAGDDRYEAGEFSQGGAYYWGLGVLYDRSGRDLYYGNRYGQAFAAHQALGVLADDAGDDVYWSMTAASQSGSWDICSTLLIDRAGDDSYQADGLAQGGASQQAIAMLVDLSGTDRYAAPPGGATIGQSGGDAYHFDACKCNSFSLFLDAGGAADLYTRPDRPNDATISTGAPTTTRTDGPPANSSSSGHGLFIDTTATPSLADF